MQAFRSQARVKDPAHEMVDASGSPRRRGVRYSGWVWLTLLGLALVFGSLAFYQGLLALSTGGSYKSTLLIDSAYAVPAILITGLTLTFSGLTRVVQDVSGSWGNSSQTLRTMGMVLIEKPYLLVFRASSIVYGLIFALVSSTLVYQPGIVFTTVYGVNVPSVAEVICCGPIGQMPQLVLYLTQNLALLLVPINLVLMFTVSWLVGLNTAVATYAYKNIPKSASIRWIGGIGSTIGLFTACPACASFFFLTTVGLTGALSLAASLASLQGFFIVIGVTILTVTPVLTSNRMLNQQSCALPKAVDSNL